MKRAEFSFELPPELIAHYPEAERSASRLLVMARASGALQDRVFHELVSLLRPDDLLVFNDTRVIPARLWGQKASGGRVEILVERILSESRCLAHVRASKAPKPGSKIRLDGVAAELEMVARHDALFELQSPPGVGLMTLLESVGHMPLPPYIERQDELLDQERYQTVYARNPGAVAAPTAGLHFDADLLAQLAAAGVKQAFVTLHVGAGTFQPVRADDIRDHQMHSEWLEVSQATVDLVNETRQRGGRVIAVGTTSVRCLETAAQHSADPDRLTPFSGDTDIFIYPGYTFRAVNGLITNFHLPESTLIMLVSAFAGREATLAAYQHAITQRYRFFSYGDAMLIL